MNFPSFDDDIPIIKKVLILSKTKILPIKGDKLTPNNAEVRLRSYEVVPCMWGFKISILICAYPN